MDPTATILLSLATLAVGSIVSGLVTWLVSRHYYIQASRGLAAEGGKLRKTVNVLGRALEAAGLADIAWDQTGDMGGLNIRLSGSITAKSAVTAALGTVTPGESVGPLADSENPGHRSGDPIDKSGMM